VEEIAYSLGSACDDEDATILLLIKTSGLMSNAIKLHHHETKRSLLIELIRSTQTKRHKYFVLAKLDYQEILCMTQAK
jgi:hypothetical protein